MLAALPALLLPRKAPAALPPIPPIPGYVTMDVGRPGGDETVVTAWKQEDGKFVCTHVWYPPADADMRHWVRTTDGRFLPLEEGPCPADQKTGACLAHGTACSNVNPLKPFSQYFASKDTWWPLP